MSVHPVLVPIRSLELGLWMVLSHHLGAGSQTWILLQGQQGLLVSKPSLQPSHEIFSVTSAQYCLLQSWTDTTLCWGPATAPDPPFLTRGVQVLLHTGLAGRRRQSLGWVVSAGSRLGWGLGVRVGGVVEGLGGSEWGKAFPKDASVVPFQLL